MGLNFVWRPILRSPLTLVGCIMLLFLILTAILAPWIAPYPEHAFGATEIKNKFRSPCLSHPFGTDELGRDIFSRVVYGSRISLQAGSVAISLALAIGVPLGLLAGYFGGVVDEVIMRTWVGTFPGLAIFLSVLAFNLVGDSLRELMDPRLRRKRMV